MEGSRCAKINRHKEESQHIRRSANAQGQTQRGVNTAGRREEKHRNRLEKRAKTGEQEKSRQIRRAGVWEQTSSKRRAPKQGGGWQ